MRLLLLVSLMLAGAAPAAAQVSALPDSILLAHPDLAKGVVPFARYITSESTLSPRHRELLILRTAWLCRSDYHWAHYAPVARQAGFTNADLRRIALGPDEPGWDGFEAVLLRMADELHTSSFVIESTWAALTRRYDTHQAMDAVFTVAEFTMLAGTVNSLRVPLDKALADRLPADVPHRVTVVKTDERLTGKTARIDALDPAQWTPEIRAMLDPGGSGRAVAAVYRTYAQHPKMYAPRQLLSEYIRLQATLDPRTRELLIMRIGWLCRSEYEWGAHAPAGRRAGMSDADVQHVMAGPQPGGDSADEVLLRAVDELYADDVIAESTWKALAARLNAKQLLDVLITTGGYRMVSMSLNTFGVQLEPNGERFPAAASR